MKKARPVQRIHVEKFLPKAFLAKPNNRFMLRHYLEDAVREYYWSRDDQFKRMLHRDYEKYRKSVKKNGHRAAFKDMPRLFSLRNIELDMNRTSIYAFMHVRDQCFPQKIMLSQKEDFHNAFFRYSVKHYKNVPSVKSIIDSSLEHDLDSLFLLFRNVYICFGISPVRMPLTPRAP
jgi:hypothetical protein